MLDACHLTLLTSLICLRSTRRINLPISQGREWALGGLGQETEILIGVLVATVDDPSGRAPTPDY